MDVVVRLGMIGIYIGTPESRVRAEGILESQHVNIAVRM